MRLKLELLKERTADDHQRVPDAAESSRAVPEGITPTVSVKELSEALVSILLFEVVGIAQSKMWSSMGLHTTLSAVSAILFGSELLLYDDEE